MLIQAELNLKNELIDLYHFDIALRMKNSIMAPTIELDKISFLLKVAEEENMTHDEMYIQLRDRF